MVLAVALVTLWSVAFSMMGESNADIDEDAVVADSTLKSLTTEDDAMTLMKAAKARKLAEEEEDAGRQVAAVVPPLESSAPPSVETLPLRSTTTTTEEPAAPAQPTAAQRKLSGGVMVQRLGGPASGYGQAGSPPGVIGDELLGNAPDRSGSARDRGSLGDLSSTGFKPSKATLAPNGKYLLRHNTYASCALYNEIVTDSPGLIECRLTEPLYSADGSTVLAEAGAPLTGEQRVEVGAGQTTVFTAWTELETSSGVPGVPGVRAQLDSLGAGPMGRSGTKAWIDDHTFERYSGALMLSAFQDLLSSASNLTQKNSSNSGYTVNNSERNVESMASKALDANINIPRTGYVLPGTVLTVIVARDIDFSSVFENR